MGLIFLVSLFLLSQETFFVDIYIALPQPIHNYNNVEKTFEHSHIPILAFSNAFLPDSLQSLPTEPLISSYLKSVNN